MMASQYANRSDAIWLQGLGWISAKPARDFAIGDVSVWNYGHPSEIIGATPKGKTQIVWQTRTRDGKVWERIVKADRLVAYAA
jgi:hypothetical protein